MAAPIMDTGFIAASYSISEPMIHALIDAPTVDLIKNFLQKVEEKARQHEGLQAEKLRSDVELETALRSSNARQKQYKDSVDRGLKEIEELRRKVAEEENSRASIESELQTLKSSSTTSTSELQALQSRIASLETSNSDALALLETKTRSHDVLAEELAVQQQRNVALRREISELEEKIQNAENASMASKFREQNLQQEVALLKKSNEWHDEELKRRSSEHTKFRKEKGAQVAELQRALEDTTQACEGLRNIETKLRNHIAELDRKLEEAFEKIQVKSTDAAKLEQSFRAERDSAIRLAELQRKSAETARARLQELEEAVDQIKDDAATEIGNLQADINTERTEKEAAERRVVELESRVESLERELADAHHTTAALPNTPRRAINGSGVHGTPVREASPGIFSSPGGSRLKNGLSVTQLYTQYSKAKADLDAERRRSQELSNNLDEMIQDLENRSPEFEEMRVDHDRLTSEVQELGQLLQQAHGERDIARKEARKWIGTAEGLSREGNLLRQQLRDLSAQLKIVLVESQVREQGLEALTGSEQAQLEQLARGEFAEGASDGMSDTGRFISQRLTIFRNVAELQEQNVDLLRLVRKLGEEMEGQEAIAKQNQHEKDSQELEDLRTRVVEYQDMIKSLTKRSESYVQERDMFRRMLAHRGQLPQGDPAIVFGQSVGPSGSLPNSSTPSNQRTQDAEQSKDSEALMDYVKLVKEQQQHFDAYRKETAIDHSALKEQADKLSKEKNDLQGEIARVGSQLTLAHERYSMLQSNYSMLKTENTELQKRTESLSEIATRQDVKTQQVAEDLIEARGLADSMRNETANLKAERELSKKIESRLTEDNRSLVDERSRLNKMISDLQRLQNEREHTDSETRRRLQTRLETLESELSSAKRKLDEEVDQSRKAALRREYEQEQNRTRIEDLLKGSSNAKEELVVVKTQRDQLQARIDEMKIELRNAEEKAQALQPRATTRPGSAAVTGTDENALTREQEMAVEIADLTRDIQLKTSEVHHAEEQIEEYKAIAQAAEDALESNIETTEQYRKDTDRELVEKDATIEDLKKRVEEVSSELAATSAELSELRSQHERISSRLDDQKTMFEAELARLRDESERLTETARLHQEDLKAQAEISQQAQQHYEDELVKHAEAATSLQKIRGEFNQLKSEVAGHKADAEASKAALSQNEDSWQETRVRYEQEITELKNRREDVVAQNKRVHQQLEEVSSQIAGLKKSRAAAGEERGSTPGGGSDNSQEIIRYLRQEKEIVDMQYELSIQESKRLKQQLDHTTTQLDQTRAKLAEERLSQNDRDQTATNHSKLLQSINELNLFRESNTSLRNEARSVQDQLAAKIKEVEELKSKIDPMETRVRELENELETKEGQIKILQADRDHWHKRSQEIMSKYDRVDPVELEALRTQIKDLQAEKENLLAEKRPLQDQIDGIPEQIRLAQEESAKNWEERKTKLIEQSKNKVREVTKKLQTANEQIASSTNEHSQTSSELAKVKEELSNALAARDEALAQVSVNKAALEADTEDGQIDESARSGLSDEAKAELEARVSSAETRADIEAANTSNLQYEVRTLQARVRQLEEQVAALEQDLATAKAESETLRSAALQHDASTEQVGKLQAQLTNAQSEIEDYRSKADLAASITNVSNDDSRHLVEQVTEQVEKIRAELQNQYEERTRAAEEKLQSRADNMKKQLSAKLATGKQTIREQLKQEHEAAMAELMIAHKMEIERIRSETIASPSAAETTLVAVPPTESLDAKPKQDFKLSQAEFKEYINKDPGVKNMLAKNVQQKVDQQKETWSVQIKQEEEKSWTLKLEEAIRTAEAAKEKAVAAAREMESKRMSIKLNMTDGRAKAAQAKIEVVEKAAAETPERPVGEVWAAAKVAKPATAVSAPKAAQPAATPKGPATPQVPQSPVQGQSTTPQGAPAQRQPSTIRQQPQQQGSAPTIQSHAIPSSVPPNPFAQQGQLSLPKGPTGRVNIPANPFAGQRPNQQGLPNGPEQTQQQANAASQPRGIPQPASGTGPAALRSILNGPQNQPQATGIPRIGVLNGRGGHGRGVPQPSQIHPNQQQQQSINVAGIANRGGSNIGRGGTTNRGRGSVRGGHGHVQTAGTPAQHNRNSPGSGQNSPGGARGGMNPGARQFVPGGPGGIKRPHDGDGGNAVEKKLKGGASGGPSGPDAGAE